MFSLIIAVLGILLTVGLGVVAAAYLGPTFVDRQKAIDAQTLSTMATHLKSAVQLYQGDTGNAPASIGDLVAGGYLKADFNQGAWSTSGPYLTTATLADAQCTAFNATQNVSVIPACTDPAYATLTVCCSE